MTMDAVRLTAVGMPLEKARIPVPEVGPEDVLVRVDAAGICRSDLHYRTGVSYAGPVPLTLGHEVAGRLERIGIDSWSVLEDFGIGEGDRVAVHYLVSCGRCRSCIAGREQFCSQGAMIGKHRDGGFADFLVVPARNLVKIPAQVTSEAAAVMMCSTATALHALRKAELSPGDRVAVYGAGGLGMSAIQLARAMGALEVFAVDVDADRLARAVRLGAIPVDPRDGDPADAIRSQTDGGVECALELLGLPQTIDGAIRSLGPLGRAAIAGIAEHPVSVDTYRDIVGREARIVGVSDHTRAEVEYALELASRGLLSFDEVITANVPLDAAAINDALDRLAEYGPGVRSVVVPTSPR